VLYFLYNAVRYIITNEKLYLNLVQEFLFYPIRVFLDVTNQVYLALGTNLGQRHKNLQQAVVAIGAFAAVEAVSPVYETAPWGKTDQPDFLNICIKATTSLEPAALLKACKAAEQELGRRPGERWGPRLIDIDIIFYDKVVLDVEGLTIPHPRLAERAFVLAPLADIAADFVHPVNGRTVRQLLEGVNGSTVQRLEGADLRIPRLFEWGKRTYVMGILNATPDSFSGDGLVGQDDLVSAAVDQAVSFVEAGVDIIDIGGESTRPGSEPITAEAEMARVIPVVEAVREAVEVPISIDSYRADVARAVLEAGADWINDVWGLRMDPDIAGLVAAAGCPVVIMHNRSKPKSVLQEERLGGRYVGIEYDDLIEDIKRELQESIDLALAAGVQRRQIIIDPGIGFGKTVSQNLQLLNEIHLFREMGYPILVGSSRKSFIGYTLNLPPEERMEGTAATVAIAIDRGADIVRVHDVKEMIRIAKMTDAIVRKG
jgi:dihydropteroate synthase/2-amino-4-hydroxy-6-hydroxymethyldihydropteridine diphosphokinase